MRYFIVIIAFLSGRLFSVESSLDDILLSKENLSCEASEALVFKEVQVVSKNDAKGYCYSRFLANRIRMSDGVAKLFYAKEDIMPPAIFVRVPALPLPENIINAGDLRSLRLMLGREHELKNTQCIWAWFVVNKNNISVLLVRATLEKEELKGVTVFSSRGPDFSDVKWSCNEENKRGQGKTEGVSNCLSEKRSSE